MSRHRRTVSITIEVDTNLDARTLEDRLENFLDPSRLSDELLDGERVRFRDTSIEVSSDEPRQSSAVDVLGFGSMLHHASRRKAGG